MRICATAIGLICVLVVMGFAVDANAQREWAPRLDGETQSDDGGGISLPLWLAVGPDYGTSSHTRFRFDNQGNRISEEEKRKLYGLQAELTGRVTKFGSESTMPLALDVKLALGGLFNRDLEIITARLIPVIRLFLNAPGFEISPYGGYGIGGAVKAASIEDFVFVHGLRLGCDLMTSESFGIGFSFQRTDMGKVLSHESVDHVSVEVIFGL